MSLCRVEDKSREMAERMCKVALWCVQYQPEMRPSMSNVVRMLEGEQEIQRPVNPFERMVVSVGSGSTMLSEDTIISIG